MFIFITEFYVPYFKQFPSLYLLSKSLKIYMTLSSKVKLIWFYFALKKVIRCTFKFDKFYTWNWINKYFTIFIHETTKQHSIMDQNEIISGKKKFQERRKLTLYFDPKKLNSRSWNLILALFEAKITKIDILNPKLIDPDDYQPFIFCICF